MERKHALCPPKTARKTYYLYEKHKIEDGISPLLMGDGKMVDGEDDTINGKE
jgi:hypothetical protein